MGYRLGKSLTRSIWIKRENNSLREFNQSETQVDTEYPYRLPSVEDLFHPHI